MIVNIEPGTFGGPLANGDMLAVANVIEHLRRVQNNPNIQFFIESHGIKATQYSHDFYNFLLENTNYFTKIKGEKSLAWRRVNLWDYRDISGDLVIVPNNREMQKKIVIFPLFDANYNTYRNWPEDLLPFLIKRYDSEEYKDYEKIICTSENSNIQQHQNWQHCTNFTNNIHHITTAEIFVGGDTGTSHLAWCLDRGPKELIYYSSGRGLVHTLPFYSMYGKGKMNTYWINFEGTKWELA